jgi:hypothetical protein
MRGVAVLTLIAALAGGCGDDDEAAWSLVLDGDDLDRVVLSAWASSADDVHIAGGGLGNGLGQLALHFDGSEWRELDTDSGASFWWVWGNGPNDVYYVGENGRAVYWDGSVAIDMATPTADTLFGVWGSDAGDVWAVGGDAVSDPTTGVILHLEGGLWVDATPAGVDGALFKVWGTAANDIYAVGQRGLILHWDGSEWTPQSCDTDVSLFTVAGGSAGDGWAVGGGPATVCSSSGDGTWTAVDTGVPAGILNGVSVSPEGDVWVVGMGGVKLHRDTTGAWLDETNNPPFVDLHGVWAETSGIVYTVGGNFYAPGSTGSTRVGVVGYYGTAPPPDSVSR